MNQEITVTRPAGIDVRFLFTGKSIPRVADARRPVLDTHPIDLVESAAHAAAESNRQDSLAFLHKLVMG